MHAAYKHSPHPALSFTQVSNREEIYSAASGNTAEEDAISTLESEAEMLLEDVSVGTSSTVASSGPEATIFATIPDVQTTPASVEPDATITKLN